MIRIVVVDDQRLVRKCIVAKLNSVNGFSVVAEAQSGEEAREAARNHEFDIILMDLNMPGIGGLEATRRLIASDPGTRVIGLSMYVTGPYPRQFLRAGGAGSLSKNVEMLELERAIRTVAGGKCYISPDVAQHIAATNSKRSNRAGVDALSRREIQVLQQIASGFSPGEIADKLCLSGKTIAYHRRQLLAKLDATNDVQLAAIAREQGLADIDALAEH